MILGKNGAPRPAQTLARDTIFRIWWRRGESEYSRVLKTGKLLKLRGAQNAKDAGIARNWNVSGTLTVRRSAGFSFLFELLHGAWTFAG